MSWLDKGQRKRVCGSGSHNFSHLSHSPEVFGVPGRVLGCGHAGLAPGALSPSPCPQLQHPGQRFLGAGVDQVGAGCRAEGLPVPAAEGWEAMHGHEAFIPLPPVGRDAISFQSGTPAPGRGVSVWAAPFPRGSHPTPP